ncbi:MAG: FGGY-family carbohydrate kinase, partial [Nocardioidaceae bacterium]
VQVMAEQSGVTPQRIAADGGLARSDTLLQAQADFSGVPVERASDAEYVTARGAAWMAGLAAGVWSTPEEAVATKGRGQVFEPELSDRELHVQRDAWQDATQRALGWRPAVSGRRDEVS